MLKAFIFLLALSCLAFAQTCLKATGEPVQWWVILKVPPKIGKLGYGYYDSTMKTGKFVYYDAKVDLGTTAHTRTIEQINSQNLQRVAWNDQKPSGETSSSNAHAKGVIAFSLSASKGFFLDHSLPKYPAFSNGKVNPVISASQNVYGQHLACFSLTLKELQDLASYMLITWPFVYEGVVSNTSATQSIYKLSKSLFTQVSNLFNKHDLNSALGYTIKTIFKNDKVNGSIFQDGLTSYLTVTPLIAETWGRPIQKAWCSKTYQVFNAVNLNLNGITWNEQDDHSKWVIGGSTFACFGDMNRMQSQWKRGGAFFCLMESSLITAMRTVIVSHDSC